MTLESFCNAIWRRSYKQVLSSISKKEYLQFTIPKKDGVRTITCLPDSSSLYELQRIFDQQFLKKQELPTCIKGFVKGESYISYLEPHVGSLYFERIDIKDFFPSISSEKVKKAFELIVLCEKKEDQANIVDLIADICTYEDVLPQGVPTSPMISNIVMTRIDQRITKYCQILGVTYTRYADDMLFSSESFDFSSKPWFLKKIKHVLASEHFKINYSKTKYSMHEISLNGYVVSQSGIRLSRSRLSDIRKAVSFSQGNYRVAKTDPELFLSKANTIELKHRDLKTYPFNSVFQFTQFLTGYRAYLISFLKYDIEPSFRKNTLKILRKIESQLELY